ncbi:putative sun domain protein [Botrytis fragariae]|uniref:Putative sun domain protein n=1 Tax=Botrytis fragariae TaxID=1964551 RepID=A0A8H6EJ32_9HELO|nr:putative sun domain protein [Botrytis fragariae]KAF5874096.1 putative sun domain protein [Botrytis fragariae]
MKFLNVPIAIAAAAILLIPCEAKLGHGLSHLDILQKRHSHNRIHASPRAEDSKNLLQKRGTCEFPTDAGLVAVTPDSKNAGWAMSPDQACTPGSYCPYACPPGEVMAQWNPKATSYTYPLSMDGGLYCDSNGKISKPFSNQPYCVSGTGTVGVVNSCGGPVSFCQTVLPGNEAMLIPTSVDGSSQLAVPGTSYWCETAAHYYINAPGVSTADACIWGDGSKPIGNWAPYVAGANTVANGDTYLKIGWNPIWTSSSLSDTMPTFGIKIECSGSGCNGLPCSIDPSVVGIGGVTSADQASGAGGANFCVVTVPSGLTADVVVFEIGGSGSSASSSSKAASSSASPSPSPTPTPTHSSSSSIPTTLSTPPPSTSSPVSSTSTSASTSSPSPSSSSSSSSSSSPSSSSSSSAILSLSISTKASPTSSLFSHTTTSIVASTYPTDDAHVFLQAGNSTVGASSVSLAQTVLSTGTGTGAMSPIASAAETASATASSTKKSAATSTELSNSVFGLVLLLAISCLI